MKSKLEERLNALKQEFQAGQKMLADLQQKQANLQETLLRISGAIQVLEETLTSENGVAEQTGQEALKKTPVEDGK